MIRAADDILEQQTLYPFGQYAFGSTNTSVSGYTGDDVDFTGHQLRGAQINRLHAMHDMQARYYVSGLAMFGGVDPLASSYAGSMPYHYVHNNPINFVDPTGMASEAYSGAMMSTWSSQWQANERAEHLKEKAVESFVSDSFEWVEHAGEEVYRDTDGGQASIHYEGAWRLKGRAKVDFTQHNYGSIAPVEDNWFGTAKRSSVAGNAAYSFVDPLWVTAQSTILPKSGIRHLDGTGANQYDLNNAVASTAATAVPYMRAAVVGKASIPAGLHFARLNAAQFSAKFKGTAVARMAPALRGKVNKAYNYGIGYFNKKLATGGLLLQGINQGNGHSD